MIAILAIASDLKSHIENCKDCKLDKDTFCEFAQSMYAYCLIAICRAETVPRYAVEKLPSIVKAGGINAVALWKQKQGTKAHGG